MSLYLYIHVLSQAQLLLNCSKRVSASRGLFPNFVFKDSHTPPDIFFIFDRFREMFEIREDISAHKWLWDKHHVNTIIENRLPWATLLDVLRDQIARNLSHLTDEFQLHQNKVTKLELKSILNNNINCLNLTLEETNRLWLLFEENKDETTTPTISMMSFVKGLNLENHCKPINLNGVGESIINRSINRELIRKQAQMDTLNNQAKVATKIMTNNMTADDVLSMLGENMNKHSASAREVFIKYSKKIPTTGKPLMISVNTFLRTLKSYRWFRKNVTKIVKNS